MEGFGKTSQITHPLYVYIYRRFFYGDDNTLARIFQQHMENVAYYLQCFVVSNSSVRRKGPHLVNLL